MRRITAEYSYSLATKEDCAKLHEEMNNFSLDTNLSSVEQKLGKPPTVFVAKDKAGQIVGYIVSHREGIKATLIGIGLRNRTYSGQNTTKYSSSKIGRKLLGLFHAHFLGKGVQKFSLESIPAAKTFYKRKTPYREVRTTSQRTDPKLSLISFVWAKKKKSPQQRRP